MTEPEELSLPQVSAAGISPPPGIDSARLDTSEISVADSWQAAVNAARDLLLTDPQVSLIARVWTDGADSTPQVEGLNVPVDESELQHQLMLHGVRACQSEQLQTRRLTGTDQTQVFAARSRQTGHHGEALVVLLDDSADHASVLLSTFQCIIAELRAWSARAVVKHIERRLDSTSILIDLLTRMESSDSLAAAAGELANSVSDHFGVRVIVTGFENDTAPVLASSETGRELSDEDRDAVEAAVLESILQQRIAVFPPPERSQRIALLANKHLADHFDCAAVISSALTTDAGEMQAGWCFLIDESGATDATELTALIAFVSAAQQPVAAAMKLLQRAEPTRLQAMARAIERSGNPGRRRLIMWLVTLVIVILLLPMKYSVNCAVQLEPVARRFVSVPFDSPIERSHVEPGDMVAAGQLIAELDGRDIRLQLEEVRAEKARAGQEQDGHRARGDYAAARLAEFDMRKHAAREKLLLQQIQDLQVCSPINGLVIAGDWKKQEGSPLEQGQSLFEIAPLDAMVVEVGIPEFDIALIEPGQEISVTLESNTERVYVGRVGTIHPRAELRDNANVFIAEIEVANSQDVLRPGMRGRAKIRTVTRPLGWNILRVPWLRFVDWLRFTI